MSRGIDVVFASHNGARTLPRMLAALERLDGPAGPWRILAVDNASTDQTGHLLKEAEQRLPLTALTCVAPGKMPAIRLALAHSTADLIVFTDDDVEPSPAWIAAYEAAAIEHQAAGVFGGPITPLPLEPLSDWFDASWRHHAELFALTPSAAPQPGPPEFYGPNFMLRRQHLGLLDAIPSQLGPTFQGKGKTVFPMGEDSSIMEIAWQRGIPCVDVPEASVRHLVRAFQTDLEFMLQRAERHGRGWAIRHVGGDNPTLLRRLKVIAAGLPGFVVRRSARAAAADPAVFDALWNARWRIGAAKGAAFGPFPPAHRRGSCSESAGA